MHCKVTTEYCREHDCIHGQEAELLRAGVEKLLEGPHSSVCAEELQDLLDRTAAADCLAYLEAGDVAVGEILAELIAEGLQPLVRDGLIDDARRLERANNIAMIVSMSIRLNVALGAGKEE